jgi:hypothetical protein
VFRSHLDILIYFFDSAKRRAALSRMTLQKDRLEKPIIGSFAGCCARAARLSRSRAASSTTALWRQTA